MTEIHGDQFVNAATVLREEAERTMALLQAAAALEAAGSLVEIVDAALLAHADIVDGLNEAEGRLEDIRNATAKMQADYKAFVKDSDKHVKATREAADKHLADAHEEADRIVKAAQDHAAAVEAEANQYAANTEKLTERKRSDIESAIRVAQARLDAIEATIAQKREQAGLTPTDIGEGL